jgi:hypothetical protein
VTAGYKISLLVISKSYKLFLIGDSCLNLLLFSLYACPLTNYITLIKCNVLVLFGNDAKVWKIRIELNLLSDEGEAAFTLAQHLPKSRDHREVTMVRVGKGGIMKSPLLPSIAVVPFPSRGD